MAEKNYRAIAIFDIDGVIRDVGGSYRRALADTVEQFTGGAYRPSQEEIDRLKGEGIWNNDWEGSQELVYRYFERQGKERSQLSFTYEEIVAFFQSKYRGTDPVKWNGYICEEPLLVTAEYFEQLSAAQIGWGFFSGATRGSATYILEKRIGLRSPALLAMEDAPGKPDPTGLIAVAHQLTPQLSPSIPVIYAGDTVADLHTVANARMQEPDYQWIAVGILPPHAQVSTQYRQDYYNKLKKAGAVVVLDRVTDLTPDLLQTLA
jgi:HAD superfamily phosphatase